MYPSVEKKLSVYWVQKDLKYAYKAVDFSQLPQFKHARHLTTKD